MLDQDNVILLLFFFFQMFQCQASVIRLGQRQNIEAMVTHAAVKHPASDTCVATVLCSLCLADKQKEAALNDGLAQEIPFELSGWSGFSTILKRVRIVRAKTECSFVLSIFR
jgi:hypothetical protein